MIKKYVTKISPLRPAISLSSKKKGGGSDDESSDEDDEDVDETAAAVPQNTDKVVKDFEEELVSVLSWMYRFIVLQRW